MIVFHAIVKYNLDHFKIHYVFVWMDIMIKIQQFVVNVQADVIHVLMMRISVLHV